MEIEFDCKISIQDNIIDLCRLCLEVSNLQPLSSCQYAKEFSNFNFIEVEICCKFPDSICGKCVEKLDEIGLFLITCQRSYCTYKKMEINCSKAKENLEKQHSTQPEIKRESIVDFEEVAEVVSLSDGSNDEDIEFEIPLDEEISNCEDEKLNSEETESVENEKPSTPPLKMCHMCGACVPKLVTHYKMNKNCRLKNFWCKMCNLHFATKYRLIDHQRAQHRDKICVKTLKCHICSKTFKYNETLKRHLLLHENGKQFICEICGRGFSRLSALKDHRNTHSQARPYSCKFCGKTFRSYGSCCSHQYKHKKSTSKSTSKSKPKVSANSESENYVCAICDRNFSRIGFLNRHLQSHDDVKEYECKKCEIKFETFQLYRQHSEIHRFQKRFVCSYCHKRFTCRIDLDNHIRVHTGELPYLCSRCGRKFRTDIHLRRHMMLIHNVNRGKPFSCTFCDKTFALKGNLVCHIRIHTGERPYKCHVCSKSFIDSSARKRHVRKIHGEDEVQNIVVNFLN